MIYFRLFFIKIRLPLITYSREYLIQVNKIFYLASSKYIRLPFSLIFGKYAETENHLKLES